MRLLASISIMMVIAFPIANCQVKMRVREKDLIIPTKEPDTEATSEIPQHIKGEEEMAWQAQSLHI